MLQTYLKYLLLKLVSVKEACLEEEKNKIYKFRYQIYHNEYDMIEENYDHKLKILKDPVDDQVNSIIAYTESKQKITSTCRLNVTKLNDVPVDIKKIYALDELMLKPDQNISFAGRLAVNNELRGRYLIASLSMFLANKCCQSYNCYHAIASCSPSLLRHYMQLGYRPYTKRLIQFPDRVEVPIAMIPDLIFLKNTRSIIYPIMKKYCNSPLFNKYQNYQSGMIESFIPNLDLCNIMPFAIEKHTFLSELKTESINFILKNSLRLELQKNMILFSEIEHHQEKFILLAGELTISRLGEKIMVLKPGDVFGELGSQEDRYLRYVTVTSSQISTVIILPRHLENKLLRTNKLLYSNFMAAFLKAVSQREKLLISKFISLHRRRVL